MRQVDKELLIQDLSARTPNKVYCKINNREEPVELAGVVLEDDGRWYAKFGLVELDVDTYQPKPYLRPMSGITDEELEELHSLACPDNDDSWFDVDGYITKKDDCYGHLITYSFIATVTDFLTRRNFDFRGLIPKGLAIEAPENMYNYKTT